MERPLNNRPEIDGLRAPAATSPRIRVLHVVLNVDEGGLERILGHLVSRVDSSRFDTHILAVEYLGRLARGLDQFATLHVGDKLPRWSMLWPGPLIAQIRRIAPDIVHMHTGIWYKASLAARRAGVPSLVYTEHGRKSPDPVQDRLLDRFAARRTDVVVPVSDLLARQLASGIVEDASRLQIIHNGIDTAEYQPTQDTGVLRAELGVDPNTPIIGSIGRLAPIKGFDVMVDAFAGLRARWTGGSPPVLVIAGDGPQRSELEQRIEQLGLRDSAHLVGWRDDIRNLHSAFSIYSMTSRSEGTSISLLEAMSSGLCPVVTDVGGNSVVLGPALAHRLCASENPPAIAGAWIDALSNTTHLEHDGATARNRVASIFSLQQMVTSYEELYTRLAMRNIRL